MSFIHSFFSHSWFINTCATSSHMLCLVYPESLNISYWTLNCLPFHLIIRWCIFCHLPYPFVCSQSEFLFSSSSTLALDFLLISTIIPIMIFEKVKWMSAPAKPRPWISLSSFIFFFTTALNQNAHTQNIYYNYISGSAKCLWIHSFFFLDEEHGFLIPHMQLPWFNYMLCILHISQFSKMSSAVCWFSGTHWEKCVFLKIDFWPWSHQHSCSSYDYAAKDIQLNRIHRVAIARDVMME